MTFLASAGASSLTSRSACGPRLRPRRTRFPDITNRFRRPARPRRCGRRSRTSRSGSGFERPWFPAGPTAAARRAAHEISFHRCLSSKASVILISTSGCRSRRSTNQDMALSARAASSLSRWMPGLESRGARTCARSSANLTLEQLHDLMRELWVARQVERRRIRRGGGGNCSASPPRRPRAAAITAPAPAGSRSTPVKPEDLFDHGAFEDMLQSRAPAPAAAFRLKAESSCLQSMCGFRLQPRSTC